MKNKTTLIVIAIILFLASAACTVDLAEWKFWEGGESSEPALPLVTSTFIPTLTPINSEDLPTETPVIDVPTVTPIPPTGPSTNATGASCLPGVWQINHQSVINYMNLTMYGVDEFGFTPQSVTGKLEMQITPGRVNLVAEDFNVDLGVHVGEMANLSAFTANINSNATASYLASDSQVSLTGIQYDANGEITSLTASFNVAFIDLLAVAQSMGFAQGIPNPITSATMKYTCSGDILTIVVNPYSSVSFDRVIN